MNVLDLFSGIGGFSLGLERAGMRTVAFCEIDPRARKVLARHWPDVPCYDDVRTLTADRLRTDCISVDAICGGFPCQDISNMGDRAGLDGERSGLWADYARLIRELRPDYVMVENVAALLGLGMGTVLGDLATLGYDAEWHGIPAGYLGAPHERDRLWIVAYAAQKPGVHKPNFGEAAQRLRDDCNYWRANPWDETRPRVCRMEDGPPDRVDRTEECGNAVIPQIPEIIGRAIMKNRVSI